jgi:hypothetical protein
VAYTNQGLTALRVELGCAEREGPQNITLHGQSVAVVVSRAMFDRLTGNELSFVEFMQSSPLYGAEDIAFERDISTTR